MYALGSPLRTLCKSLAQGAVFKPTFGVQRQKWSVLNENKNPTQQHTYLLGLFNTCPPPDRERYAVERGHLYPLYKSPEEIPTTNRERERE